MLQVLTVLPPAACLWRLAGVATGPPALALATGGARVAVAHVAARGQR